MGGASRRRGRDRWSTPDLDTAGPHAPANSTAAAAPSALGADAASLSADALARHRETVRAVSAVLDKEPVDLHALRRLAAVRGLGTHALRARAWPLLLGAARPALSDAADLAALAQTDHRDRSTVDVDVARSLWAFTEGWEESRRDAVRAGLKRVLNAAVAAGEAGGGGGGRRREGGQAGMDARPAGPAPSPPPPPPPAVHYYQGLHDVASVLLLVTGSEPAAFRLLRRLCVGPLRDCTRPTLAPALAAVSLLPTLLAAADPALAAHLAGTPPHYALPWHLTWFAHGVPAGPGALAGAARLFDLFAATHPLMPLYVAAAALIAGRGALLACCDASDPGEVHAAIARLPRLGGLDPDGAALRALELYGAHPPAALLARAAAARGGRSGGGGRSVRAWVARRRLGSGGSAPDSASQPAGPGPDASAAASARLGGRGFWVVGEGAEEAPSPRKAAVDDGGSDGGGGGAEVGEAPVLAAQGGNVLTTVVVSAVGLAIWALSARAGGGAPL